MKKFSLKTAVLLSLTVLTFSCAKLDEVSVVGDSVEKPTSVIVDEKISSYDLLKDYSGDSHLGVILSGDDLASESPMLSIIKTNFEQLTPITEINSNVIVDESGFYSYDALEAYVKNAEDLGLSVYGNGLVSNDKQSDVYFKSLVMPYVYRTPLFPNMVSLNSLYDGSFTDWTISGDAVVEEYIGESSLKLTNGASVSATDATSIQSPVFDVVEDGKYELTFYLMSSKESEGRVVFTGLNENTPAMDWTGSGSETETFTTKVGWNAISVQTNDLDGSGKISFRIELGYTPDVTFYLNIQGLSLVNVNGSVDNPDEIFVECEDATTIGKHMILFEDGGASGGKYLEGIIDGDRDLMDTGTGFPSDEVNEPLQFICTFNVRTAGTYYMWLRHRCYLPFGGDDSWYFSIDNKGYFYPNGIENQNSDAWSWSKHFDDAGDTFELSAGEHTVAFKIREGGHFFDKIYFTMTSNEPSGFGSAALAQEEVTLDISQQEKKGAIETALSTHVSNVMTAMSDKIADWTVVEAPFAEDGSVAVGDNAEEGTFYWANFIGDEYIDQAFSTARATAPEAKLFVSEDSIVGNSDKITAVSNLLTSNANVDGVAISLSLDLNSDLDAVGTLFETLAATGKMVYVASLSVDAVDDALQSERYQRVVELYKTKVPVAQQYGISLSDLIGDKGLWNDKHNRKHSYMGFAIGLGADE